MATKPEYTGKRSLEFSQWVKENLPDSSTGYMVTDLDFFFYDYKRKKVAIVEVKQHNKIIDDWQNNAFRFLRDCIRNGKPEGWEFIGYFVIRFENTNFSDGKVYLDGTETTEEAIRKKLSFL